ncbi:DUF1636 family protein [Paracoccus ravus]|uniref:DUF1636 family protein n=1 Tax=Paracoccus ravus TaxID=2447760 RepID=UPI00106EB061|nr:DUF1636 domain-containing protein [Paracoccus ravus]
MTAQASQIELLICTRCNQTEGEVLFRTLTEAAPEAVAVTPVECLSNCSRGCTIALRGAGRWTYVYGNLDAGQVEVIREGLARYLDAADGLVPWRERPEHFRKNCIARIPPLETI